MPLSLFGLPIDKLRGAVLASVRARALSALHQRHAPSWPDPLDADCPSQSYGPIAETGHTWILAAAARGDLLRFVLARLMLRASAQRPRLIVVAADPTVRIELLARAEDWFRLFGVPFQLMLPDTPPSAAALLRFAEQQRGAGQVLLSPADAYAEDPEWDRTLFRAARASADGMALGHRGAPDTDSADKVPVLAWSRPLTTPWPEQAVCAIQWAPAFAQPLPQPQLKSLAHRALAWGYRNKDALFTATGKLVAFAGWPREGFYGEVNGCFLIPGVGYLVSGWLMDPLRRVRSVTLRHPASNWEVDLTTLWTRVPAPEVDRIYRQFHLPEPSRGYVAFVPEEQISVQPDAARVEVVFAHDKGARTVLDGATCLEPGIPAIQQVLTSVAVDSVHVRELIQRHVNPVLRALRCDTPFPAALTRACGEVPARPRVSIVVPLYGRWDFLRYQLAAFSRDPALHAVEWLYVVDDPRLIPDILAAVDGLYSIFGLPFRVLYCGRNLGFSGACNLGAAEATGDQLLLLNSDVFPIERGWLQHMQADLLPSVAAVGARLLYEDGAVQHMGMDSERYGPWDGLRISTHPGKGLPESVAGAGRTSWPAATAACLLMRRQEFLDHGGLSEDFVIGDFEDGDLCRRLRDSGREIHVAQRARLYHLERQSLAGIGDNRWRQSLTLYNCWLFNDRAGEPRDDG